MDSRKPLTAGEKQEIGELLYRAGFEIANGGTVDKMDVADMHRTCRRLLSLLTPPPDAAVREAVEELERKLAWLRSHPKEESANVGIVQLRIDLDILLSYVRAVQAPRLTPEQVEFWVHLEDRLATNDTMWPKEKKSLWYRLRAAFPEAFAGEVGRG